jgi:hypothetical protein
MRAAVFEDVVLSIRLERVSKLMETFNQNYLSGLEWKARANNSDSICILILVKYGKEHLIGYFISCFKL